MGKLLINESPLIFSPRLAALIGIHEAIFLQQLNYWLEKSKHFIDGHYWVYNTYEGWVNQFPFVSVSTIKRMIKKLERDQFIITANYNPLKVDRTKWYRINYETIDKLLEEKCVEEGNIIHHENNENEVEDFKEERLLNKEGDAAFEVIHPIAQNESKVSDSSTQNESNLNFSIFQNDHTHYPNWKNCEVNLNRAIPEITTDTTSEITTYILKKEEENTHAREEIALRIIKNKDFQLDAKDHARKYKKQKNRSQRSYIIRHCILNKTPALLRDESLLLNTS